MVAVWEWQRCRRDQSLRQPVASPGYQSMCSIRKPASDNQNINCVVIKTVQRLFYTIDKTTFCYCMYNIQSYIIIHNYFVYLFRATTILPSSLFRTFSLKMWCSVLVCFVCIAFRSLLCRVFSCLEQAWACRW